MDAHPERPRRNLNVGLMVSLLWCAAVWVGVLHLLGLGV
jgi:hypothetical protein